MPGSRAEAPPPRDDGPAPIDGALIAERFQVLRRLGQGGMGTVYEAFDILRDESVAIKVLAPGLLQEAEAVRQFLAEAAITMRLHHPNIVTVHDLQEFEGRHVLVMELLRGRTLRDVIQERNRAGLGTVTTAEAWHLLQPLCAALEYAHAFTVHRDLKPENVWVSEDGTVKLMDFGLAKLVHRGTEPLSLQTLSQLRLGSPYYMAPEQLQDARHATPASDQFALGVMAYELLSGKLPVGLARPLRDLRPDLPYQLTSVVDRALRAEPGGRFPSVAEWARAFEHGLHARRSWRQLLDTHPRLRRTALIGMTASAVTAGSLWAWHQFTAQATSLTTRIHTAHDDLFRVKSDARDIARDIEDLRLRHVKAAAAWREARAAAAPAPAPEGPPATPDPDDDGNVERTIEAIDPPAALARELAVARTEHDFLVADAAWSMLAPRLSADGDLPRSLETAVKTMESAMAERDFEGFIRARSEFEASHRRVAQDLTRLNDLADAHVAVAQLARHASTPVRAPAASSPEHDDASPSSPLADDDWDRALAENLRLAKTARTPLAARAAEWSDQWKAARTAWAAQFSTEAGPPPVEFLGHPEAKARAAEAFRLLDRYDRALPLLEEAATIVRGWTREVVDLHQRCEPTWAKAKAEGRAFEDVLGMRFVRIGEGREAHYWSLWETRVMDFARYVDQLGRGSESAGSQWRNPGFAIGPTHPVTWVDRSVADHFAQWYSKLPNQPTTGLEGVGLPLIKSWKLMLGAEPGWQQAPIQSAILPSENELRERHWFKWISDPQIDAGQHIQPVGQGEPSSQGLYDLFGNAWEWAIDAQTFPDRMLPRPYGTFFGGGIFGQVGFDGVPPPREKMALVNRAEAVGFRISIHAESVDDRLGTARQPVQ
jgi:hypothetical protein